jgi:hypothetical protein
LAAVVVNFYRKWIALVSCSVIVVS